MVTYSLFGYGPNVEENCHGKGGINVCFCERRNVQKRNPQKTNPIFFYHSGYFIVGWGSGGLPCFSLELALTQAQVETQEEEEQSLLPPHRKIKARERKLNQYMYLPLQSGLIDYIFIKLQSCVYRLNNLKTKKRPNTRIGYVI